MKKKSYFIMLFLLMLTLTVKVKASTCSDQRVLDLSSLANNVNVSYQQYDKLIEEYDSETFTDEEDSIVKHTYPAYYLTIYNLTDDLNVSVTRDDTSKVVTASSKDKNADGVVYIDTDVATRVKMFTVKIRSNDSNCKNEVLKTTVINTPMYNQLSTYNACQEYPDFDLCQQFTTNDYSNVTSVDFTKKLEEYKVQKAEEEKKQKSIIYNIGKFISTYRWYIIIPAIIIGVALIVIYIIRRKKSRLV